MSGDPKLPKGLTSDAYDVLPEGVEYEPFVAPGAQISEFTVKALISGIIFGILFGAANAYLGLRVGLTISTSIPVAVLTVALFRALDLFNIRSSILEANLSQTVGSASSSVASGVIFTLPALFLWGFSPDLLQMTLLAMSGGLLGILFMIPLRRFLIAREHGKLPYPEGTACAEVLVASEAGGARAKNVFLGLGVGALMKFVFGALHLMPDQVRLKIPFIRKAELSSEMSAALLGVGYILGPRTASIMVGGGLLSWLVIIPAIAYFGEGRPEPMYPETLLAISDMTASQIWTRYIRYIGAGAVATAGLLTLIKSLPTMVESFKIGSQQIRERLQNSALADAVKRTDRDHTLATVGIGVLIIGSVLTFVPQAFAIESLLFRAVAAILVVVFAFFFVTVSSRIVGLVGVTSNPTSGMTIATLLGTAAIFLMIGWTDDLGKAAALTVGCVVAIAASIAGDTSQDLKTGFLLGATPKKQQTGELVGVLTSAVFVCATLLLIGKTWGFGNEAIPAPQAMLMKVVIEGVLDQSLPWALVAIGAGIAIVVELAGLPSLAFSVGVYLPVATMIPVFFGGLLRHFSEKTAEDKEEKDERRERGVLFGSGLVGGEGLFGVAIAGYAVWAGDAPHGLGFDWAGPFAQPLAALTFAGLIFWFWRLTVKR